jgi:sec-independent protein translocase protein TatA
MIPGLPQVGGVELLILLSIILLFFGAKRIPSLARSLGEGTKEFRKGISGQDEGAVGKDKRQPENENEASDSPPESEEAVFAKQKKS